MSSAKPRHDETIVWVPLTPWVKLGDVGSHGHSLLWAGTVSVNAHLTVSTQVLQTSDPGAGSALLARPASLR